MQEFPPSVRSVRFGIFEVDLRTGELRKKGIRLRLQGQPFLLLVRLLKEHGEVVTREELRSSLWPQDTFIDFHHSLGTAVNKLREVLGDSAANPRFVETLPRRGYRFIAPVVFAESEDAPVASETPPATQELATGDLPKNGNQEQIKPLTATGVRVLPRWSISWKISVFALVVLSAGLVFLVLLRIRPSTQIRSLAVLPLENLSGDASQDYFSDGMTDELITELGQIRDLRVISRTSAMSYKGTHKTLPEIAQDLNVDAVVEGAVLRSGNQVRITAELIMAVADKQLWAKSYNGDLRDTLTLQSQVARAIAEEIRMKLSPHEQAVLNNVNSVNPEAYEAYLKGRYFWNIRTADGLTKAIDYLVVGQFDPLPHVRHHDG